MKENKKGATSTTKKTPLSEITDLIDLDLSPSDDPENPWTLGNNLNNQTPDYGDRDNINPNNEVGDDELRSAKGAQPSPKPSYGPSEQIGDSKKTDKVKAKVEKELEDAAPVVQLEPGSSKPKDSKGRLRHHDYHKLFIRAGFQSRYNTVRNTLEIKFPGEVKYREIDDATFATVMYTVTLLTPKDFSSVKFKETLMSADVSPRLDPFATFVDVVLPKWDGKDHIGKLVEATAASTPDKLVRLFYERWLKGVIVGSTSDRIVNELVLVFYGKQGARKDTFIRDVLMPTILRDKYYSEKPITKDSKDIWEDMASQFIYNVSEGEALTSTRSKQLKSIISMNTARVRPPFGRFHKNYKRRASLTMTTNDSNILVDDTGNRRLLIIESDKLDPNVDIDQLQLYAQAKEGKWDYWLTEEEFQIINEASSKYQQEEDPYTIWLNKHYIAGIGEPTFSQVTTASELLAELNTAEGDEFRGLNLRSVARMGKALTNLTGGAVVKKLNNVRKRGYFVQYRNIGRSTVAGLLAGNEQADPVDLN